MIFREKIDIILISNNLFEILCFIGVIIIYFSNWFKIIYNLLKVCV